MEWAQKARSSNTSQPYTLNRGNHCLLRLCPISLFAHQVPRSVEEAAAALERVRAQPVEPDRWVGWYEASEWMMSQRTLMLGWE